MRLGGCYVFPGTGPRLGSQVFCSEYVNTLQI